MTDDSSKILKADTPFGEITFNYRIKKGLKRIYIRIERDGQVVLRSAPMAQKTAVAFIAARAQWILNAQNKIKSLPVEEPLKVLYFMGVRYGLVRRVDATKPVGRIEMTLEGENAVLVYNPSMMRDELIEKKLDKFYRQGAEKVILPLVAKWSEIMGVKPSKVAFRKVKSRWGSCSSTGSLSFNISLMKAPLKSIEYVVIHELAHIRHHNHGKNFWAEVARFMPDFASARDFLKTFRV